MSEISGVASYNWYEYLFGIIGFLFTAVNLLAIYIFKSLKTDLVDLKADVAKLEIKVDADHDVLNSMYTEHQIFHPKKKK